MKFAVCLVLCLVILCEIEARKHHHKKHRKRGEKHDREASNTHSIAKVKYSKMQIREHKDKVKHAVGLREQMRNFQDTLNKMLPRCKRVGKCPKGTCCWKGQCKIYPHRINQRCSVTCPCKDEKGTLFCHIKRNDKKHHIYGRCYIKEKEIGIAKVNFIPKAIEKLKDIEKKLAEKKEKRVEKELEKRHKKKKHGGRKHKRNKHRGRKHGGKKHGAHKRG
eukprot:Seg1823.6 transcript_id=Seg1823.6/GoldUCD/mRNA.D3Y31 product="hypothetical protein" protein_id=Seg1823.6/GoldUCD/D3Y31